MLKKLKRKIRKFKYVCKVAKKAHWSVIKANRELNMAKEKGISYKRYIKNKCWNMNNVEIKQLSIKIKERKEKKLTLEEKLMTTGGMTKKEAAKHIARIKKFDVPKKKYVSHYLFELNDKELKEYLEWNNKKKEVTAKDNEFIIEQVMKKTKWSKAKTIQEMDAMKEKGISYKKYAQKGVYSYTEEELQELLPLIDIDKDRVKEDKEEFIKGIMEATGWNRGKTELEVLKAKVVSGCSYEDYLGFKMWELTPEEQKTYVTLGSFDKLRIEYNEFKPMRKAFDDKAGFNKIFKDYIKRVWFTNENLTFNDFEEKIKDLNKIIVKPLTSKCGDGVEAFECNKSKRKNKKLYKHIMSLGESIIEEYIVQTDEMAGFCPTSVNTIRIYTIVYKNKCNMIYGLIRMGNGGVVDNFHANGLAAGIDVKKGVVETNAVDLNRDVYEESPSTGKKIKGFKIPEWDTIVKICNKVTKVIPEGKLIGWDFAITNKGVDLIEGNPGAYYVAQLVHVEDKKGLMPVMVDPYL